MTPEQLSDVIVAALTALSEAGTIALPDGLPAQVLVERPKVREHGDYATNVALQLAKKAGMNPREFAQLLADALASSDGISSAEIAGPGFLNIRVEAGAQGALAPQIVAAIVPTLGGIGLGGTGLLIVVSVVVETMKQIEAQLLMRNYEGFIR